MEELWPIAREIAKYLGGGAAVGIALKLLQVFRRAGIPASKPDADDVGIILKFMQWWRRGRLDDRDYFAAVSRRWIEKFEKSIARLEEKLETSEKERLQNAMEHAACRRENEQAVRRITALENENQALIERLTCLERAQKS